MAQSVWDRITHLFGRKQTTQHPQTQPTAAPPSNVAPLAADHPIALAEAPSPAIAEVETVTTPGATITTITEAEVTPAGTEPNGSATPSEQESSVAPVPEAIVTVTETDVTVPGIEPSGPDSAATPAAEAEVAATPESPAATATEVIVAEVEVTPEPESEPATASANTATQSCPACGRVLSAGNLAAGSCPSCGQPVVQ